NSCLDFSCSAEYDYLTEIPNYLLVQYSIPQGALQPMIDMNPTSVNILEMPMTTSCSNVICEAEYTVSANENCIGTPTTFTLIDENINNDEIASVLWTFENGYTSTSLQPTTMFLGPGPVTYTVQITTVLGCEYTVSGTHLVVIY